jgi:hypothetical protein
MAALLISAERAKFEGGFGDTAILLNTVNEHSSLSVILL